MGGVVFKNQGILNVIKIFLDFQIGLGYYYNMNTKNRLFDTLEFNPHSAYREGALQAKQTFENGYTISVVTGEGLYGDINEDSFEESTFELAVFDAAGDFVKLTLHDDVIGHQTRDEVSHYMTLANEDPLSLSK